jgi:hypothetical protein
MKTGPQKPSVKAWAWTISIIFHLVLIATFMFMKFSASSKQPSYHATPTANLNKIDEITNLSPVVPKPKVKDLLPEKYRTRQTETLPPLTTAEPLEPSLEYIHSPDTPITGDLTDSSLFTPNVTEFFGQMTYSRKICYVVDCSGSMQGMFSPVRARLKNSISSLQPDQYFYIIFFRGDKLLESGTGRLTRASNRAKQAAQKFIDTAQPSGPTNALNALKRAMQITDASNRPPELIYFLTDGFDLQTDDGSTLAKEVETLRKKLAAPTTINTIGFWTAASDAQILKTIAQTSNGSFTNVTNHTNLK